MTVCLVTGGAGFIGSHLVHALVARNYKVRVLDNFSTGALANLTLDRSSIELLYGDLNNLDLVRRSMDGVDLVFHQAAPMEWDKGGAGRVLTQHAATTGTLHVLIAAREAQVRRVIFASSGRVYGRAGSEPRREEDPLQPTSPYAMAKVSGEKDCLAFTQIYGLETVRLRYFNVFGPRQPESGYYAEFIVQTLKSMLTDRNPAIPGDGLEPQDYLYVDDIVHANLLAAEVPRLGGGVYNIARGRATAPLEIVARINGLLGTRIQPIFKPPRPKTDYDNLADVTRAEIELGFCPSTCLEHGLQKCIDFYILWRGNSPGKPLGPAEKSFGS